MRKNCFLNTRLVFLALALLYGTAIHADQTWSGVVTSAQNVVDENLSITGDVTLSGGVHIEANTVDVLVTLSGDYSIAGDTGGNSVLYLETAGTHTITFRIDNSLTFKGSPGALDNSLFVVARGTGSVKFDMFGSKTVALTRNGVGSGVDFYLIESTTAGDVPHVIFERSASETVGDQALNVTFEIGALSTFGFGSGNGISSADQGILEFIPSNPGAGRMVLSILDTGALVVSGRFVTDPTDPNLPLSALDKTLLAGCNATLSIVNTQGATVSSSLLVTNSNNTLGEYLVDPWNNLGTRADLVNYKGTFDGVQYGFIIGAQGALEIQPYAYLDYVGLSLDMCPTTTILCDNDYVSTCCNSSICCCGNIVRLCDLPLGSIIKKRNPSALIIDGSNNPASVPAYFDLNNHTASVFRSGVDALGTVRGLTDDFPFSIDPALRSPCAGNMVLDVEGQLNVFGAGTDRTNNPTKLEILSLFVEPTGGPVLINGSETIFPLRSFATDANGYVRYNSGYFFVNNCMVLCSTWLVHTDENHVVLEKDDVHSEPSYVGGETFTLVTSEPRPKIVYSDSTLMVHSNIALTGVDQLIPNTLDCTLPTCTGITLSNKSALPVASASKKIHAKHSGSAVLKCDLIPTGTCADNNSSFIFFNNGNKIDAGTGRQMILGTYPGSTTCNCCNIVSRDSHLDIMQTTTVDPSCAGQTQTLSLYVEPNNDTIVQSLTYPITGQLSIQTIYLGNSSNISVGTEDPTSLPFTLNTESELSVVDNFYSFETRGGPTDSPETSNVTGRGGIFVDETGSFVVSDTARVNMATMVTLSGDGEADIPRAQVYFAPRVGQATWNLDLTDPAQRIIVPQGNVESDYTLNWLATTKDYDNFTPYVMTSFVPCLSQVVTTSNISSLPVIQGTLDQLQFKESRLYDPAHILIDGGWVREVVFLSGCNSAEGPAGVIVLDNTCSDTTVPCYGRVGLGSAHRNVDSLQASTVFGLDGVTIIANGNGIVTLNEDMIINNTCHIVAGPDFGASTAQKLIINSDTERKLTIRSGGLLDLTTFTDSTNQTIEFGGNLQVVLEPGACIAMGGATLRFTDNVVVLCERLMQYQIPTGTSLTTNDALRCKFVGVGTIKWAGNARMNIGRGAAVGVENLPSCDILTTNLTFELNDDAAFIIGEEGVDPFGGSLQIGNTATTDGSVTFSLIINGNQALFEIGSQGFLGLAVGLANKPASAPNNWLVGTLFDVSRITINVAQGTFSHNRIYTGSDSLASLLAIGPVDDSYRYDFTPVSGALVTNVSQAMVRGGGNIAQISGTALIAPTVGTVDGVITSSLSVSIMGSTALYSGDTFTTGDATALYTFMKTDDISGSVDQPKGRANAGRGLHNQLNIGYIDTLRIGRQSLFAIVGRAGTITSQDYSVNIGAVIATLRAGTTFPRAINQIYELQ